MQEAVECAECGNRYDSQASPFCPRCGSTKTGALPPGALASSQRADPRRRRVQMAGVVLMVLGLFTAAQSLYSVVDPRPPPPSFYEGLAQALGSSSGPGGALRLHVVDNGTLVGNATVRVTALPATNGSQEHPVAAGRVDVAGLPSRYSNATLRYHNQTWYLHLYAAPGQTLEFTFDVADQEPGLVTWQATSATRDARILAGFSSLMALLVVLGGVCAVRLRGYKTAIAAGLVLFVPLAGLTLMFPNVVLIVYLLLIGGALYLIVRGRPFFARKAKKA